MLSTDPVQNGCRLIIQSSAIPITFTVPLMVAVDQADTNVDGFGRQHSYTVFIRLYEHTGLWLRTGCVTNAQVSVFERTGFEEKWPISDHYRR